MNQAQGVTLSIVIPHAGTYQDILRVLQSIADQNGNFTYEVLVVANPPEKYSENPFSKFKNLLYLTSKRGANSARNVGLRASQGEIILFLDDDCALESSQDLNRYLELHRQYPSVAGIGGGYTLPSNCSYFERIYNELQHRWIQNSFLPGGYTSHLLGGNSSFKSSTIKKYEFDETILFGGTETELQVRLYWDGHKLMYVNSLNVCHHSHLTFLGFMNKLFKQGIGAAYIQSRLQRPPRYEIIQKPKAISSEGLANIAFTAGFQFFQKSKSHSASRLKTGLYIALSAWSVAKDKMMSHWHRLQIYRGLIDSKLISLRRKHDHEKQEQSQRKD